MRSVEKIAKAISDVPYRRIDHILLKNDPNERRIQDELMKKPVRERASIPGRADTPKIDPLKFGLLTGINSGISYAGLMDAIKGDSNFKKNLLKGSSVGTAIFATAAALRNRNIDRLRRERDS